MGTPAPQAQAPAPHPGPVFFGIGHNRGNHVCRDGVRMTRPKPITGLWFYIAAAYAITACIALVMLGRIGD
jgi:hypothetical protein